MKKSNYRPNPKPYGLALLAGISVVSCQQPTEMHQADFSANESVTVLSCPKENVSHSLFSVAEKSSDGLFIRVVANGKVDKDVATEILATCARSYERIDICEPGKTERGEECMSYISGILVDYRTGEAVPIDL